MFAGEYPDEVAGMVLIEASNPDAWKRLGKPEGVGVDHTMLTVAPWLGRLGVFRLGIVPSYSADPDLPDRQRAELQAFFDSVKSLLTIRDVDSSFSQALDQVRHTPGIGAKPLAVVLEAEATAASTPARPVRPTSRAVVQQRDPRCGRRDPCRARGQPRGCPAHLRGHSRRRQRRTHRTTPEVPTTNDHGLRPA
jgi:hypothetical protein